MKKYPALWLAWFLAFLGIEFMALKDSQKGGTLSETVRNLIGTGTAKRTGWMWVARGVVLGLLVWLIPHFMTGSV